MQEHYEEILAVRNTSWKQGIVFVLLVGSLIETVGGFNALWVSLDVFFLLLFVFLHNASRKAFEAAVAKVGGR